MNARLEMGQEFDKFRKTGDPEYLSRVFDASAQKLLLLAAHLVREDSLAEDLVQSTFIRAVERADQYDARRPFLPWITGILVHEAKKLLRRLGQRPDPRRLPNKKEPGPDEAAVTK